MSLTEIIYECPSKEHLDKERTLTGFRYQVNGQVSPYFFCNPCRSLYEFKNDQLIYVDKDNLENIPTLIDEKGNIFDAIDLDEDAD